MEVKFSFEGELWVFSGNAAWCFITLPAENAEDIKEISQPHRRGFGSLRVKATIGTQTWHTSIFPDSKSKSYVLPVKKEIREKCGLEVGRRVKVKLSLIDL